MLEEQGEDGMIHSFLSSLPVLVDSEQAKDEKSSSLLNLATLGEDRIRSEPDEEKVSEEESEKINYSPPPLFSSGPDTAKDISPLTTEGTESVNEKVESPLASIDANDEKPFTPDNQTPVKEEDTSQQDPSENPPSPTPVKQEHEDQAPSSEDDEVTGPAKRAPKPPVTLCSLLLQSDELFTQYPPSHPSLALSSIMGPQSVVFTWSERFNRLPDDDEAEAMVEHPELVVRPRPEPEPVGGDTKVEEDKVRRRRALSKRRAREIQRRQVWVTAAVVVGLAVAAYGFRHGPRPFYFYAKPETMWAKVGRRVSQVGKRLFDS